MSLGNLAIEENAFFYTLNQNKAAVYERKIEFDKNIDKEKLRQALNETIKYFDRFRMKAIISKDGHPKFIENNEELPIYDDNGQIFMLGTKETNGYLYALTVKESMLRVVLFHILCDGKGSGLFIRTLLLHYIKLAYDDNEASIEIEKLNLSNEHYKKNMNDLIVPYVETNLKNEINKPFEYIPENNVFIIDRGAENFYDNYFYTTNIEWDANALIDIVHKYDTKPFIFFFMIIADAMIELFDVKEKNIIANAAIDLRKFLNCNTLYNFGTSIDAKYDIKWYKLAVEEKISHLKEMFSKKLDYNKIVLDLYKVEQMMKKVSELQNVDWLKAKRKENFGKVDYPLFSCFISNVGKVVQPEVIEKYTKRQITFSTPINVVPDYTIFTYGKIGRLTQSQNFECDCIMKKVFEKLENFGIKSHLTSEKKIELSHFDTLKLEKI